MAPAQPPLSAKQNGIEIVRFMAVALVAGFVAHLIIPADASRSLTLLVMFLVGLSAGIVNKWIETRFPSTPSMPSSPAALDG
jgi:hypothetical protein